MDIVDTFNHLIPSDQLDDSLLIGQNLECDASNEFGTLVQLEDSLRNMLSDKDPMLGSASCSQFDLLDNEDSSFQIAGPTGLEVAATDAGLAGAPSGELKSTETAVVKRPVGRPRKKPRHPVESEPTDGEVSAKRTPTGRPGRKPVNRLQKSFLIEKGVTGADLKKELTLGGRINISDLDVGLWINPVVVLKRLTVTVGGFRIELLPGPSYAANAADAGQSVCFEDSFSYCGDIQYAMLQDDAQEDAAQENQTNLGGVENMSTEEEDVPLGLGPYVNPNEVQAANGALMRSPCAEETKPDNQSGPTKHKPVGAEKDGVKQPQNTHGIKTDSNSKDKEKTLGQKQLKSKQALTPLKSKNSSSSTMKGPKSPQNKPSKITHAPAVNRGKTLNEKDVSLKRHGEELQNEHAPKVQKMQDKHANKVKPKSPGASSGGGKKSPSSSDSGHAEPQGPTKNSHVVGPKPESSQPAHGATGHSSRSTEDGGQEKSKVKKPEKILQRQKSKTVRSLSVDEPQLFIPDNAPPPPPPPVVKKETVEDQTTTTAASSDTAWEGNNCGLCKKHHNNTFMVGCGRCDDWFHGDCVGLDLTKVREMEEEDQMYVCLKCCAEEPDTPSTAKPEGQAKPDAPQDHKAAAPPPKPRPGQLPTSPGARPVKKESERKQSTEVKDTSQKTAVPPKLEMKKKTSSPGVKKPASVDEIRRSVRDSLKEILLQRLKDSDLKITSEKASEVAKKTERELFHLYRDTDSKYKNKYRSLMFNLKDTKNNVLFKRVLKAEISPAQLIRMSPEELASKELAAWRKRENRHTIEMIEKQEREVERRPITKITHKGEIEIESQEPAKTSEIVEPEPAPKVTEALLDHLLPLEKVESAKTVKDTTAQHKSHLFDLHCKICTGRMAPPVEEAPTKVVATTVVRRQSAPSEDPKVTTPPVKDEDLHLTVLEESFLKAKSFVSEGRSEFSSGRAEEAAFLSTLNKLWRGFINMPQVAKLVTKVFPVSGILDNLTEDLPDSIQVGGRISPQIVWDYLEKIRATGTKEVCLVRFSPETEEDEISYTLLFAYFSSRKRFGVVANNKKKVKDMYIIPLGSTEKVPHQLVPFDGPGLENNRCNLLLGLIIRQGQGPKKDFLPVDMNETARIVIPEIKKPQQSVSLSTQEIRAVKQEEKRYLTSLAPPAPAKEDKLLNTAEDADEPVSRESFEEASAAEEGNNQESNKPLRFLPGVLVGWGGELPPLPDFGPKPKPAVDHSQRTQQPAPKADAVTPGTSAKSPTAAGRLDRFVIKKREPKPVQAEPGLWSPTGAPCANISAVKEAVTVNHGASVSLKDKAVAVNQGAPVSLKDKPPDMSTEAFLASLSTAAQGGNEAASVVAAKTGEVSLPPETPKSNPDGNSLSLSKPQATSDQTNSLKPPISGILKKCSAYSNVTEEKRTEVVVPEATANNPAPFVPQPVPVLTSVRHDPAVVSRQEAPQSTLSPTHTKREGASVSQASVGPAVAPTTLVPSAQQPQAVSYAATHTETTGFQYESPTASIEPTFSDAAPVGPTFSTAAPVETTFSNVAPVETTFSTAAPVEPTFSNVAPVETTFSNVAPVDPTFSNVAPVEPTFSNTAAVDPTLSDAATVEPTFSNAATVEPTFSNAATVDPTFSNAAPFPAQQPQVPGSFVYPGGPPPNVIPPPHLQDQNHAPPWAQDRAMPPHTAPPPGPLSPYADSYPPNELPLSSARDYKRSSDEYSDPWERPRHPEDRDHHGRHRHHSESRHGKKSSRHHSRERGKKHERGGHEDKYRDGSRQSGHTDDRHGERRKERHHSDEYRSKEKDRHRHRRDSDYENGRRNSKDL